MAIRLTEEEHKVLRVWCVSNGMTVQKAISGLVLEFLSMLQEEKLRVVAKGIGGSDGEKA